MLECMDHSSMKIGIAQINTTVGDLDGNCDLISNAYNALTSEGADMVIYPELVISGYPPMDLLLKSRYVQHCMEKAHELARICQNVPMILGCPTLSEEFAHKPFYNSALVLLQGEIIYQYNKQLLPNYDVFDETRYFEVGASVNSLFEYNGQRIALTICEDIWKDENTGFLSSQAYSQDPLDAISPLKPDLLLNLSASPWHVGKEEARTRYVSRASETCNCPVVYCNAIGGNDELIFDGQSMAYGASGAHTIECTAFEEEFRVCDIKRSEGSINPKKVHEDLAHIEKALVLGLRDYAHKSGFKKAVIGLSGGIDSALTAYLAAQAFGPSNVLGVSLPSSISSQHSKDDARDLAENLGIQFETLPIAEIVDSVEKTLGPLFEGLTRDVTEENIQARSRGILLMSLSNKLGSLLLTTGNKSELAVGYCTLYGDMAGGLAVISDLLKTRVFELCQYINRNGEIIPESTLTKPPSAELRPDQKDEDSLPPYEILDGILQSYVEEGLSRREIIENGFDEATVLEFTRKVDLNEYKRKQAPPGLKITPLAFGIGRRIPIVQKYKG